MLSKNYLKRIWKTRYFWLHLALADLRAKYRRSMLGLGWSILQPLALTLLLSFVMGNFFHIDIRDYAPYIFSGLIIWEFIVSTAVSGCMAFINSGSYIKQFSHPLVIYSLRGVLASLVNLALAFVGLVLWVLFTKPENFGFSWLSLILAFPLLLMVSWPLSTVCAFIGTQFRDFSQLVTIILQAVWYASPVFFEASMFRSTHIGFLVDYNPVYHILNLFRAPMLHGQFPDINNYLFTIAFSAILMLLSLYLIQRNEQTVIFYI